MSGQAQLLQDFPAIVHRSWAQRLFFAATLASQLSVPTCPQEALLRLDAPGADLALALFHLSGISVALGSTLRLIHSSLVQRVGMILNQAVIKPGGWRTKWFLLALAVWRQE